MSARQICKASGWVAVLMTVVACGGGAKGGSAAPSGGGAADVPRCGPEALIDDGEDNNNQVLIQDGRAGYWYTFVDDQGSTVSPTAGSQGGTFTWSEGGANGSAFAARMSGDIMNTGANAFAGMGFNFVDPKDAYDTSKYGGIAFWAKRAPETLEAFRLKIPDNATDPQGGLCTEACFNDFGLDLTISEEWTEYVVTWESAKQMPYWGKPRPEKINAQSLYGMQWQANKRGKKYDLSVDDISFIGCGK